MLSSLAVVISIPAEWLVIIAPAIAIVLYVWARRAAQASVVTESKVLTAKTVENIKDLWEKRDDLRDDVAKLRERLAYLEGAHAAKGCFPPRPPAK